MYHMYLYLTVTYLIIHVYTDVSYMYLVYTKTAVSVFRTLWFANIHH